MAAVPRSRAGSTSRRPRRGGLARSPPSPGACSQFGSAAPARPVLSPPPGLERSLRGRGSPSRSGSAWRAGSCSRVGGGCVTGPGPATPVGRRLQPCRGLAGAAGAPWESFRWGRLLRRLVPARRQSRARQHPPGSARGAGAGPSGQGSAVMSPEPTDGAALGEQGCWLPARRAATGAQPSVCVCVGGGQCQEESEIPLPPAPPFRTTHWLRGR